MAKKKATIILVLKTLEKYSSINKYLTQQEIIDYIYTDYNIEIERKSVASSLKSLIELEYDIDKKSKGGYALLNRTFERSQLYYLMDAVYSSHNISKENANELISKLIATSSDNLKDKPYQINKASDIFRTDNKQIFYNIEILNEAINNKKKVSFNYLGFNNEGKKTVKYGGYRYKFSPYYLINNFSKYYVIGNYNPKYGPINTFRIDYMVDIKLEDEDSIPMSEFKELANFSIDRYINEHIYLFGGKVIDAVIEVTKPESLIYVYDWFGDKIIMKNEEGKFHIHVTCDEFALLYWMMQYGEEARIISPQSIKDKIVKNAKELIENHKGK